MSAILYSIRETLENVARACVTEEINFSGQCNVSVGHSPMAGDPILVCSECVEFGSQFSKNHDLGLSGALVSDCTQAETGQCEICLADFI